MRIDDLPEMAKAERRAHLQRVFSRAARRSPGRGVVLSYEETWAVIDAIPDSAVFEPFEEGNVVWLHAREGGRGDG